MMKYKILPLGLLLVAGLVFAFLNSYSQTFRNTSDRGVVINGVKWATCNVANPGAFTSKPEDTGMLYQWNREIAWSDTADISNWDASIPGGNTWEYENDPSPAGWRVPNFAEIQTLLDTTRVANEWITVNGVDGRKFTDKFTGNSLFLPTTGYRNNNHGVLNSAATHGYYWCSTQLNSLNAYGLRFSDSYASSNDDFRGEGKALRCVAE